MYYKIYSFKVYNLAVFIYSPNCTTITSINYKTFSLLPWEHLYKILIYGFYSWRTWIEVAQALMVLLYPQVILMFNQWARDVAQW
jgi:hypothetical protein